MVHKIFGLIFVIFGAIAVIGSILYFVVLGAAGEAVGAFNDSQFASQAGLNAQQTSDLISTISAFLMLGWLWGIAILISGLAAFWFGLRILRSRSK